MGGGVPSDEGGVEDEAEVTDEFQCISDPT